MQKTSARGFSPAAALAGLSAVAAKSASGWTMLCARQNASNRPFGRRDDDEGEEQSRTATWLSRTSLNLNKIMIFPLRFWHLFSQKKLIFYH
jgi:hypothetical protein